MAPPASNQAAQTGNNVAAAISQISSTGAITSSSSPAPRLPIMKVAEPHSRIGP